DDAGRVGVLAQLLTDDAELGPHLRVERRAARLEDADDDPLTRPQGEDVADLQRRLALVWPQLARQPLADDRLDGLLALRAARQRPHAGAAEALTLDGQVMHARRTNGVLHAAQLQEAPAARAGHARPRSGADLAALAGQPGQLDVDQHAH